MPPFKKGHPKLPNAGRSKGTPNKLTATVKDAIIAAFNELQNDPNANLIAWGKKNTTAFYMVASKVIPSEINHSLDNKVITVITPKKPDEIQDAEVIP